MEKRLKQFDGFDPEEARALRDRFENDEELPQETCNAMMRTADLVLVRPPEAQWIINAIGYLNGAHEIF